MTAKGGEYRLIGTDVSRSPSPSMMEAAFEAAEIEARYQAIDVVPTSFERTFAELKAEGISGMNVTMPYKQRAASLMDSLGEVASKIGVVNTVKRTERGYEGFNTDVVGIVRALREAFPRQSVGSAVLLGAGGTARAFVAAMNEMGCRAILVLARDSARASQFCDSMALAFPSIEFPQGPIGGGTEGSVVADLVFNATPASPTMTSLAGISTSSGSRPIVFDAVYNPIWTDLLTVADGARCPVVHGYQMLLEQGAAAFELWTGRKAPVEVMRGAMLTYLGGGKPD